MKKSPKNNVKKGTKPKFLARLRAFFGKLFGIICGFFAGVFRAPRTAEELAALKARKLEKKSKRRKKSKKSR